LAIELIEERGAFNFHATAAVTSIRIIICATDISARGGAAVATATATATAITNPHQRRFNRWYHRHHTGIVGTIAVGRAAPMLMEETVRSGV
jgi:hypothetical protein